jgi:hypothetical protein
MKTELIAISTIKLNPSNPRTIKDDKFKSLVKSIKDFPKMLEIRPIVVNDDRVVLGGNMRLKACQAAGMKKVPVIKASDLTAEEQRQFIIKDNVGFGEWDWEMLQTSWDAEQLTEWGVDLPEFGEPTPEASEDDYQEPEGLTTDIVLGDLFEIGQHRLLCGDSTDAGQVARLMDGNNADIYVIDPPFEVVDLYQMSLSLLAKSPASKLLLLWDYKRFSDAPLAARDCGWTAQYEFVWDCVSSWYTPNRPLQRHKTLGYFCDDPKFDLSKSIITDGKYRGKERIVHNTRGECDYVPLDGAKHISTVESFPNTQLNDEQGHGKPIKWISAIMRGVGGKSVYDAFSGSGAFLVASHQIGIRYYGMEIDPHYCQVIVDRMLKLDPSLIVKRNGKPYEASNAS